MKLTPQQTEGIAVRAFREAVQYRGESVCEGAAAARAALVAAGVQAAIAKLREIEMNREAIIKWLELEHVAGRL